MKAVEITFHPEATMEYAEAYAWYLEHGANLGGEFRTEMERALRLLGEAPLRWMPRRGRYGRLLLRRFPFALYYKVDGSTVQILAVGHTRRRPGYWRDREQ